jgi:PAS domain S-box-containing protein
MDGTEAAEAILELRDLPIVFLTNHAEREYVERVKAISRHGYVLKNAGRFVLLEAIATAFELHRVNRELREREYRLNTAERLANVGGWELDLATGKAEWSDQFFRICGFEPGEFEPTADIGMTIIHPDDRERAQEAVQRTLETGEPYDLVKRIVRPDGSVRHVHSLGEVVRGADGEPARLVGSFLDITERTQAQRALEESEARFAAFMDHFPGAAFLKDRNNRLLYCNRYYASLLGTTPEELVARESSDQLSPELREQYERENRKVIDQQELVRAESVFPGETGNTYWLTYKFPVALHGDVLLGAVSIEITEQKRAEKRFETIFMSSPVSLWEEDFSEVHDRLRALGMESTEEVASYLSENPQAVRELASLIRVVDVNQATLRLFEATDREQLLGSLDPLIPDEALPNFRREIEALWAGESYSGEVTVVTVTGRKVPGLVEVSVAPGSEESWARVLVSILDIHELKEAQESLADSEERFRYILKHDPNAIAVFDTELRYIFASDRYLHDYGVKDWDIVGKHHYEVFPEIPQRWREIHQRVLAGEILRSDRDSFERPDGSVTYNRWECRPWYHASGAIAGMITYTEVITERVRAEQQKDLMFRELGHRIKNNLNLVSALIHLKDEALGQGADLSDIAGGVEAIRLTYDTLRERQDVAETEFRGYVADILASVFALYSEGEVTVENQVPELSMQTATAATLGLIVNELATNAVKHGFVAGEAARFYVGLQTAGDGEYYVVTVSNNGAPFPPDVSLDYPMSLGLRLVSAMVEQLEGTVELTREPETTFSIWIPAKRVRSEERDVGL